MAKILILTIIYSSLFIIGAIGQRTCGSELDLQSLQQNDPQRYQRFMQIQQQIVNLRSQGNNLVDGTVITIPVVVHVLHGGETIGTGLNISLQQIQSQIDVLNEDFRRLED